MCAAAPLQALLKASSQHCLESAPVRAALDSSLELMSALPPPEVSLVLTEPRLLWTSTGEVVLDELQPCLVQVQFH